MDIGLPPQCYPLLCHFEHASYSRIILTFHTSSIAGNVKNVHRVDVMLQVIFAASRIINHAALKFMSFLLNVGLHASVEGG